MSAWDSSREMEEVEEAKVENADVSKERGMKGGTACDKQPANLTGRWRNCPEGGGHWKGIPHHTTRVCVCGSPGTVSSGRHVLSWLHLPGRESHHPVEQVLRLERILFIVCGARKAGLHARLIPGVYRPSRQRPSSSCAQMHAPSLHASRTSKGRVGRRKTSLLGPIPVPSQCSSARSRPVDRT